MCTLLSEAVLAWGGGKGRLSATSTNPAKLHTYSPILLYTSSYAFMSLVTPKYSECTLHDKNC